MKQLFIQDLQSGDILLRVLDVKKERFLVKIVQFFQKITGHYNYLITHASMVSDIPYLIESDLPGLVKHSLLESEGLQYGNIVYRSTNQELARGAAAAAQLLYDIHMQKRTIGYNYLGSALSLFWLGRKPRSIEDMDVRLSKMLTGSKQKMICSQIIVYAYQWAGEQMRIPTLHIFRKRDSGVSPAALATMLQNNPWFNEVGYMIRNER